MKKIIYLHTWSYFTEIQLIMTEENQRKKEPSLWALSPLMVFLCLYLVTSIALNDFYKIPITIAFLVSSIYGICITTGLTLNQRINQYSISAANPNIMTMIWIFILAGAFASSTKAIGAVDATVSPVVIQIP